MTNTYQEKIKPVKTAFSHILAMSNYEMIVFLQKQFNRKENEIKNGELKKIDSAMELLRSECTETEDAIKERNFSLLRDGIGDQITVAHYLAFVVEDLVDEQIILLPQEQRAETYTEYQKRVKAKLDALDFVLVGAKQQNNIGTEIIASNSSKDEKQKAFREYMVELHSLPQCSQIDIRSDLSEITFSSLSKICTSEANANETLQAYQKKGYSVHIAEAEYGWVILSSEDQQVGKDFIPKNKFLKSTNWIETQFDEINEAPLW